MDSAYKIVMLPVSKRTKYLRKYRGNLSDEILDCVVVFYLNEKNKVVYSKLVVNTLNIPTEVVFEASFFSELEHEYLLASFPLTFKHI